MTLKTVCLHTMSANKTQKTQDENGFPGIFYQKLVRTKKIAEKTKFSCCNKLLSSFDSIIFHFRNV